MATPDYAAAAADRIAQVLAGISASQAQARQTAADSERQWMQTYLGRQQQLADYAQRRDDAMTDEARRRSLSKEDRVEALRLELAAFGGNPNGLTEQELVRALAQLKESEGFRLTEAEMKHKQKVAQDLEQAAIERAQAKIDSGELGGLLGEVAQARADLDDSIDRMGRTLSEVDRASLAEKPDIQALLVDRTVAKLMEDPKIAEKLSKNAGISAQAKLNLLTQTGEAKKVTAAREAALTEGVGDPREGALLLASITKYTEESASRLYFARKARLDSLLALGKEQGIPSHLLLKAAPPVRTPKHSPPEAPPAQLVDDHAARPVQGPSAQPATEMSNKGRGFNQRGVYVKPPEPPPDLAALKAASIGRRGTLGGPVESSNPIGLTLVNPEPAPPIEIPPLSVQQTLIALGVPPGDLSAATRRYPGHSPLDKINRASWNAIHQPADRIAEPEIPPVRTEFQQSLSRLAGFGSPASLYYVYPNLAGRDGTLPPDWERTPDGRLQFRNPLGADILWAQPPLVPQVNTTREPFFTR